MRTRQLRDAWKARNPDRLHHYGIKHLYGLSSEEYAAMLARQNGQCAICGKTPAKRRLVVDHCHETGAVRGLLCIACNVALGRLAATAERFEAVTRYLAG